MDGIFEPFYTTREPSRSGLGLEAGSSVVETCGGSIRVASTADAGSTLRV